MKNSAGLQKRISLVAGILILSVPATALGAQSTTSPEAELLAVDDHERKLVLAGDAEAMRVLAHPDLHINAPTNEVLNRDEFLQRLKQHIIAFENLRRFPEEVVITGNIGIVMGREEVLPTQASESAKLFGMRPLVRRYTNVYIKDNGRWRFLARHANVTATGATLPAR